MGRPKLNNAEYFPHYTSLRNHRKIKMLRNRFGNVLGYAFWCMMLEWLSEHDGLEWSYSELECEMFASELGVSVTDIPPMVDFCIRIELLFKSEDGFIYSESLNDYLEPVFTKRNRERQKSKERERRDDGKFTKPTSDGVSATEMTTGDGISVEDIRHSIVEYSIVEESKEDKSNIIVDSKESKKVYNDVKSNFLKFYQNKFSSEYYFEAKDGKKIKSLISKLKFKIKEKSSDKKEKINDESLIGGIDVFICKAYECDNFIKENFTLSMLDSKFNELYSKIKHGKQSSNPNTQQPISKIDHNMKAMNETIEIMKKMNQTAAVS